MLTYRQLKQMINVLPETALDKLVINEDDFEPITHLGIEVDHPDVKEQSVDVGIYNFLQELWAANVRTWLSCQGGILYSTDELIEISEVSDIYYQKDDDIYECGFVIIEKEDFEKAQPYLPKNYKVKEGTGMYLLDEDIPKTPKLFIYWQN